MGKSTHLADGGWYCSGIDILTGKRSDWGSFKPNNPRIDPDKGKPIKYEHPFKTPTEAFFLRVPDTLWLHISDRYGIYPDCLLPNPNDPSLVLDIDHQTEGWITNLDNQFWQWLIKNPQIPIIITEGAKKTGCLLTAGYCAIGLPGIYNGYRQPKDEEGIPTGLAKLIPQISAIAQQGREIIFGFDHDEKPNTQQNVNKAISKTGKLLELKGCKVSVITWKDPYKGVDDLITAKGVEYFHNLYIKRLSLSEYRLKTYFDLTPDKTINQRYIGNLDDLIPDDAQLIGIKALHGTGKTEAIAQNIQKSLWQGQRVLVNTHREQLARELAGRFGVDYRTELRTSQTQGILGYSLCIDSLHPKANPPFNPENWENAVVIIDEVEQVLWHLVNSNTCKHNRVAILKNLKSLLQTVINSGGKIFLSDADLSGATLDYVEKLIGYKPKRFILENTYVPNNKRKLHQFKGNDPKQLIKHLKDDLRKGKKIILHTDGQKVKSQWGTINIESMINQEFPHLRVLRVDSETVANSLHPAFGCIENFSETVTRYDVVICSPVLETGVSIDGNHFDAVYVISSGVQTVDSVLQTMQRVRADIPRYIWVKKHSFNRIGNGSNEPYKLQSSTDKLAKAIINQLQNLGINEVNDLSFHNEDESTRGLNPSLEYWSKRAALINNQAKNFAEEVSKKAVSLGYELIEVSEDDEESKQVGVEMKEIRDNNYQKHCDKVSSSPDISNDKYEALKNQKGLTDEERLQLEKATISRLYTTEEVTEELIKKHDNKWFPKIRLHYYLTVGNCYLPEREKKALANFTKDEEKPQCFQPDLIRASIALKIHCLKRLEIEQFFEVGAEFSSESLKPWFERLLNPFTKRQIKDIFNINISEEISPIQFVQQLLMSTLGLKLKYDRRKRRDGKILRIYKGCDVDSDQRGEVFERWLARDLSYVAPVEVAE